MIDLKVLMFFETVFPFLFNRGGGRGGFKAYELFYDVTNQMNGWMWQNSLVVFYGFAVKQVFPTWCVIP